MATFIKKQSISLFLTLLLCLGSTLYGARTVIFDMGGVLVQNNSWTIAKNLGLGNLFTMFLFDRRNPIHLNRDFFDLLNQFFGEQQLTNGRECAFGNGLPLPQVMCDWLAGIYSGPEIAARTSALLEQMNPHHMSKRERRIFKKLAWNIFDPQILAAATHPLPEGVALLRDCFNAGNRIILLSNFDPEGFIELYNKPEMRELFDLIPVENMVISGFVGMIKPHDDIFDYTVTTYKLDKELVVFIDDQEENCRAAQKKGIRSFQFNKKETKKLRTLLEQCSILPA